MPKCEVCGGFAFSDIASICINCKHEAESILNRTESALRKTIAPAQEEKDEMEPIERLAIAAEKYVDKCEENDPLHKRWIMAQLNHIDGAHDPKHPAVERRAVYERAYFAALGGLAGIDGLGEDDAVYHAQQCALETVRQWPAMMAELEQEIAK